MIVRVRCGNTYQRSEPELRSADMRQAEVGEHTAALIPFVEKVGRLEVPVNITQLVELAKDAKKCVHVLLQFRSSKPSNYVRVTVVVLEVSKQ
jgi:hypothetical protein